MIEPPRLARSAQLHAAVLRITVPRGQIREVMGPGLAELRAALAAQGVAATGPWYTHHLRLDPARFEFEIGLPVAAPIAATRRVAPGSLRAARVAQTVFHGGYEGLPAAWEAFMTWISGEGLRHAPDFWERYLVGPEASADPAAWRTELTRPLEE